MKTTIKTQSISAASILAAGFIALSGAATVVPAQAAEPAQSHTQIVRYGDLNLDSEQGAKVLYTRIRGAAGNVCFSLDGRNLIERSFGRDASIGLWRALSCRSTRPALPHCTTR